MTTPMVEVEEITVRYPGATGGLLRAPGQTALDGVSLTIAPGETVGLVGESGSGKSTLGRALLGRVPLARGSLRFDGQEVSALRGAALSRFRSETAAVFQDPYSSLNPRMSVTDLIAEPLDIRNTLSGPPRAQRVADLLRQVGLPPDLAGAYPSALSGGQRQRVGIARALALDPRLVIADEPVSALDVSVRAGIVNLFRDLQARTGTAFLFITHDLAIARFLSHRIIVLLAGRVVEQGPAEAVFSDPLHPYTRDLIAAIPRPDRRQRAARTTPAEGKVGEKAGLAPAAGCPFAGECDRASDTCRAAMPPRDLRPDGRIVACWHPR